MTLTAWLTIVGICCLGAMSPGPSLAVVLKHTLVGRQQGFIVALTHGLGIGLYAFLCISGLAVVIFASPVLFSVLQWGGAFYLAWLGIKGLLSKSEPNTNDPITSTPNPDLPNLASSNAARDGFMIVFLNPKIAVFFISLFAQVVGADTTWFGKLVYASTAMIIDGFWYLIVAWLFSNPRWLGVLQSKAVWLDRIFGVVLIGLASKLVFGLV